MINLDLFHWQVIRKWHSTWMCRFSFSAFKGKFFFNLLFLFLNLLWVCFKGKSHLIFVAFKTLSFLTANNTFVLSPLELQLRYFIHQLSFCKYSFGFLCR